jgi:hypothetical protein
MKKIFVMMALLSLSTVCFTACNNNGDETVNDSITPDSTTAVEDSLTPDSTPNATADIVVK